MNSKTRGRSLMLALCAALAMTGLAAVNLQAAVVVNEYWADDAYGDSAEYIELYNNDLANPADLTGLSVIVMDGDTLGSTTSGNYKRVNQQFDLSGSLAAGGYLTIGAGITPGVDIAFTLEDFENGSMTIALVHTADIAYEAPPNDLKLTDASVAAITANLVDAVATVDVDVGDHVYFNATSIGGCTLCSTPGAWDTASRIPNGVDTNAAGDWDTQDNYGAATPPPFAIELGDANDALSSPDAQNGGPKYGACCNGAACTYVTQAACVGGGGVYEGNWRACTPINPCDRPCETIQDAKDAPVTTPIQLCDVTVTNLVDIVAGPTGGTVKAYHVQDASGAGGEPRGIRIFGGNTLIDTVFAGVNVGDVISLQGTTDYEIDGNLELVDDYTLALERTAGPNPGGMPAPYEVSCADIVNPVVAEPLESVRVKINCAEFYDAGGNFVGGQAYLITDGNATCSVYVPNSTTVFGAIPSGMVSITGIIAQYRPYEILLLNWNGVAGDIGPPNCASGACCLPDASCAVLSQPLCANYHYGIYQGDGVTCPPTPPCAVIDTGACWLPGAKSGSCQALVEAQCLALGGGWAGANVPCNALKTIAEVQALPFPPPGQNVYIREATVISLTDTTNGTGITYQIQDDSGPGGAARGISLFGSGTGAWSSLPALTDEGDRVMVRGTTNHYNGLLELDSYAGPAEILHVWTGPGVPAPRETTVVEMLDGSPVGEEVESTFIELRCVEFLNAGGTFAGGGGAGNQWIKDMFGNQIIARVGASDNPLVGQTIPSGIMNIRGIGGQFDSTAPLDGGYQIQLRSLAELSLLCPDICNSCLGDVNDDGFANVGDMDLFVDMVLGLALPVPCANVDDDPNDLVNGQDIDNFVALALANGGAGTDCNPPPAGTIDLEICFGPSVPDTCPANGLPGQTFCLYTVTDNPTTQAMIAGFNSCVPDVIFDLDSVCIRCPVENDPCPTVDGTYQIFRWKNGEGPGVDCYFVGAMSTTCFNCVGASTYRFEVVGP